METISRTQLKTQIDMGRPMKVVEVLDEQQYRDFHIPSAINVPHNGDFKETITAHAPDKEEPIVVYCWDSNCNASSKAAKTLESMGYFNVYDYEEGKKAWRDAGLPTEQ